MKKIKEIQRLEEMQRARNSQGLGTGEVGLITYFAVAECWHSQPTPSAGEP